MKTNVKTLCRGLIAVVLFALALFVTSCKKDDPPIDLGSGTLTDGRDNHEYKWVKIGDQVWMAENLAFKTETGSWAFNDDESNVAIYGRLYDWETATTACPAGWHLPSDAEWDQLEGFVSEQKGPYTKGDLYWENVGKHLKSKGTIEDRNGLWYFSNASVEGTDDFGFSALPGGSRFHDGYFSYVGDLGVWWSSAKYSTATAWFRLIGYNVSYVGRSYNDKGDCFSVRCVRN